jgi:steroid 5-alpha reductase family enzyme
MFDWLIAFQGLLVLLTMAFFTWIVSLIKRDVSIVDSVWSLFFLAAMLLFYLNPTVNGPRSTCALILVGIWSIRLCAYITWRNWGQPEDRRYQEIRQRNEPNFALKSLVIIFFFQAVLAWLVSMPILPVLKSGQALGVLDGLGIAIFIFGLSYESLADWQMSRFKARPDSKGQVMDKGLWRYSRHPNYFGEFCVWWGFYLLALSADAPHWVLISPLLISFLLMKVSGVPLLEKDLLDCRPTYREYQKRTNSFFPGLPKGHS